MINMSALLLQDKLFLENVLIQIEGSHAPFVGLENSQMSGLQCNHFKKLVDNVRKSAPSSGSE